jgi:hypothetical protein
MVAHVQDAVDRGRLDGDDVCRSEAAGGRFGAQA